MEHLASGPKGFRKDVEGLRAIAVVMVIVYHLGFSWATGGFAGVDVFFVISGFLITGLLVKEVERTGTISLIGFYARRAKRLFPAAATVLVATAIGSWLLVPRTRLAEVGGDLFSAAFYFINWRLAERSVDYLAEDSQPSPVQHFWSLAVEEQYYVVWPLVLLLGLFLVRRHFKPRTLIWAALVLVGLPSLLWSIYLTGQEPAYAYFAATTRMWELAIGGAVAMLSPMASRIRPAAASTMGWLGVAAIVCSLLFQSTKTPWPGYAAALPTLGAAAVILAGAAAGRGGPVSVLGTRVACWIGGLSYSLYLWHWPLITLYELQVPEISLVAGALLVACSVVLAWLTQRYIENPIRYSSVMSSHPRYALSAGLNFSFVGAVAGLVLVILVGQGTTGAAPSESGARKALGATVLRDPPRDDPAGAPVDRIDWMVPKPEVASQDVPDIYARGCQVGTKSTEAKSCVYGNPGAPTTVAIVGDSKMAQWASAFDVLARKHNWKVITYTKSACSFNAAEMHLRGARYTECMDWNRAVIALLTGPAKPDFVITSHVRNKAGASVADSPAEPRSGAPDPALVSGFVEWWKRLQAAGVRVIALADNPHPRMKVYECVSTNPDNLTACTFNRAEGNGTPSLRAASRLTNAGFIDLTDAICPTKHCAPVIGNVLIYRQGSHVTRTYIDTLAPRLESALLSAGLPAAGNRLPVAVGGQDTPQLPVALGFRYEVRSRFNRTTTNGQSRHRAVLESLDADMEAAFASIEGSMKQAGFRRITLERSEKGAILATYRKHGTPRISVSVSDDLGRKPKNRAAKGLVSIDWAN